MEAARRDLNEGQNIKRQLEVFVAQLAACPDSFFFFFSSASTSTPDPGLVSP
jgi:hypothetical protein